MKVKTFKADGKAGSQQALPEAVFDGTVNEDAMHQVVTAFLAHQRQGTASTKSRSTVRGGSRKPWRQKGTGRARAGSIRSGIWRGGSIIFGPQPRTYGTKVPKRVRRLAIQSALNARALDGDLALIDIAFDEPKTSLMAELLSSMGRTSENVLLLTAGNNRNAYLSSRNLKGVKVLPWGEASAYDVLWSDLVLVETGAFDSKPEAAPEPEPAPEAAPVEAAAEEEPVVEAAEEAVEETADEEEGDE